MNALSRDYRAAVLLADVEDPAYEDIALIMYCPIGTVRSRINRAHQMLRRRLEKTRSGFAAGFNWT